MERIAHLQSVGGILSVLAKISRRPRYAFLVLQLVAEIADDQGHSGPFVRRGNTVVLLRDWLCSQLLPLSEQNVRRAALRARVAESLADRLTGDPQLDAITLDAAVEEHVRSAGRTNVSRAISDLVRAELVSRHYAGFATNHCNRGGGRNAVYVVPYAVRCLLGRAGQCSNQVTEMGLKAATPIRTDRSAVLQGELFGARTSSNGQP
ncbi:hypothetical protein [Novosphingobium sp.]|uniref:hypothetical protein n=1 Tax=Novosphingobium sp. TaxID=1874826 RepID=UPI0026134265|nr:hypothetical protein [Novosphingobium sp.]